MNAAAEPTNPETGFTASYYREVEARLADLVREAHDDGLRGADVVEAVAYALFSRHCFASSAYPHFIRWLGGERVGRRHDERCELLAAAWCRWSWQRDQAYKVDGQAARKAYTRAKLRRAAFEVGMTLRAYQAHLAAQAQLGVEISRLRRDRGAQEAAIAAGAQRAGRTLVFLAA